MPSPLSHVLESMKKEEKMHTPGPWAFNKYGKVHSAGQPEHETVVITGFSSYMSGENWPEVEANARRIVACVNACEGIETKALELTHGLNDLYDDIIKQRDELLAALKAIRPYLNAGDAIVADSAIAKCEAK